MGSVVGVADKLASEGNVQFFSLWLCREEKKLEAMAKLWMWSAKFQLD